MDTPGSGKATVKISAESKISKQSESVSGCVLALGKLTPLRWSILSPMAQTGIKMCAEGKYPDLLLFQLSQENGGGEFF